MRAYLEHLRKQSEAQVSPSTGGFRGRTGGSRPHAVMRIDSEVSHESMTIGDSENDFIHCDRIMSSSALELRPGVGT